MRLQRYCRYLLLSIAALFCSVAAQATPTIRAFTAPVFTNSNLITISSPASTVVGDLLLVQIVASNNALISTSAGWTLLVDSSNGNKRQAVYWRLAAGAGANSFSWSLSTSGHNGAGMLAISAGTFNSSAPIDNGVSSNFGTSTTPNTANLSVLTADSLVLAAFGSTRANTPLALEAINPSGVVYDAQSGTGVGAALLMTSATQATVGTFGPISASAFNQNDEWAAQAWAIKPPSAPANLRLSLRFDEASWNGTANEVRDSTSNGNHGTSANAQTATATPALSGSHGTCGYGSLVGGSSRITVPDSATLDFTSELSAGLWVRPTAAPVGSVVLLGKGTNYQLALNSSRQLVLTARFVYGLFGLFSETLTVTSSAQLPLGSWSHVGFSLELDAALFAFDGILGQLFINGVQAGSGQTSDQLLGDVSINFTSVQLGGNGSSGLNGLMDEVRLYQHLLTANDFAGLMAERHPCSVSWPDHFEFSYASNTALTCNPLAVTLRACKNASCSSTYGSSVTATLSPTSGWVGGNSPVFTGSTNLSLRVTSPGSVVLTANGLPAASNATQCIVAGVSGSCAVTFADSGFIFDVPNTLAAKPVSSTIQAVKADPANPQACVPGFASGSRSVAFTRSYSNPNTGTQAVSVNGTPVSTATPVTLNFDASATAPLTVQYSDAGQIALAAQYAPTAGLENGLNLQGADLFVSKPYGLLLQTDTSSSCTLADISCPLYPGAVRAGDAFNLKITAVAWQSDGEPLTATALANNPATANFQLSNIVLSSQLLAPAGGSNGTLALGSYAHVLGNVANNNATTLSQTISEVGVFSLTATPPLTGYFGETVSASVSANVGRFAPAYLTASGSASLTPSCGASFSYQGQPMAFAAGQEPSLTVTGKNRSGNVTHNYDRGSFWQLGTPTRDPYLSVTTKASLDAVGRLTSSAAVSPVPSGADSGDGARSYHWSGETLQYSPAAVPLADDLPFTAAVRQGFSAAALTDADGVCNGVGSACLAFSYDFANVPGSQVRLGRLRLSNAHGSELQGLALPFNLETWQAVGGASFQPELTDSCTNAAVLGAPELSAYTGNLALGETVATVGGPLAAAGQLQLSAPGAGNDGSVQVRFVSQPAWLHYDWDATGLSSGRRAARGLASFGIYQGAPPLIFRRELYRSP